MQVPCFLCLNILIYQRFRDILGMKFMAMGLAVSSVCCSADVYGRILIRRSLGTT